MAEAYKDVELIETTRITQEGQVLKVYRITARSKGGVLFTLAVPETDLDKGKVDKLLTAQATALDAIKAL